MKKLFSASITASITAAISTAIAASAMMFTSCDSNSNVDVPFDGEVRITSAIGTRASGATWDAGDAIGVYMNLYQGDLGALGENIEYTTASGDGNFTSTSPLYFPTEDNATVDFLAYYPYVTDGSFDPTAYGVDVSNQDDLTLIDLMTASATNVVRSSDAVSLEFYHKLSNIVINITPGSGLSESDLAGLTVTLSGTDTEASYNLTTNEITLGENVADITLNTEDDGLSAEGIVIPQTLSGVKLSFATTTYGTFEASITNTAEFTIGNQYVYNVTVNTGGLTMSNASIISWTGGNNGGEDLNAQPESTTASPAAIGDYYYSDGTWSTDLDANKTAIGVIFSVGTDGTSGKVVSLDEGTDLAWLTGEVVTGATLTSDGLANMATITAISGWSTSYPAFALVDAKNTDGTTYASGATGVWYLPVYQELHELYAGMSGLQWVESGADAGDGEIDDWGTYSSMPSYSSYATARKEFNALITSASGTAISTSYWYWSSSEYYSTYAWYVDLVSGFASTSSKRNALPVRAILAF
ncbi:MAG: fimbrillin family protein [bacterium]